MRPTLEQLRHLVALAETRHFTRAAARCHIAQPPYSRSIRRLEEIVGVPLVTRGHSGARLTPAGAALATRARDILGTVDDALRSARAAQGGEQRMRIGFIEYAYSLIAPIGLETFAQTVPECSLEPLDQPEHRPEDALLSGALEMAFAAVSDVESKPCPDAINSTCIVSEPLAAVVSIRHPLAQRQSIALDEVANERLIAFARDHAPSVYDAMLQAFEANGTPPRVELEVGLLQTMLNAVRSLNGVGIAPLSVRRHELPDLTVVPFSAAAAPGVRLLLLWLAANECPVYREFAQWMRGIASTSTAAVT